MHVVRLRAPTGQRRRRLIACSMSASESPKTKSSKSRTANPWLRDHARRHRVRQAVVGRAAGRHRAGDGVLQPAADRRAHRLPPKMPLRVFTADGVLIGEFGEERRTGRADRRRPRADEAGDARGRRRPLLRARRRRLLRDAARGARQLRIRAARARAAARSPCRSRGTSSCRPSAATSARSTRSLLSWKIEKALTKDQILEIYMNQIFLGQRAYGFAAAAQIYFGKKLKDVTVAEARCWPACRRRRRPTTRSSIPSAPSSASSTCWRACATLGFIDARRTRRRATSRCVRGRTLPIPTPHQVRTTSMRSTWPRWRVP